MKILSFVLCLAIFCVSTPFALATTAPSYSVEMMVTKDKDSKEINSTLSFTENTFKVTTNKTPDVTKEFNYKDIKAADYSYSKKPLWKTGAVAAIFLGVFALPIFFMKSKSHWLTVRTEKDFAILKLEKDNYRQILAELETHGVKVETINEDAKDKSKNKD